MKKFKYPKIILLSVLLFSCIHEDMSSCKSSIALEINTDPSPTKYYKHVVYDDKGNFETIDLNPDFAIDPNIGIDYDKRFIVEVYRNPISRSAPADKPITRQTITTSSDSKDQPANFNIEVPTGEYSTLIWCDYVPKNSAANDWYFKTETLFEVSENLDCAVTDNNLKESYSHNNEFTIKPGQYQQQHINVTANRVSGRYRVMANDLEDFQNLGGDTVGLRVKVVYQQFVSIGYNVATQQPNKFIQSRSYITTPMNIEIQGINKFQLSHDLILASTGKEDFIMADIYVFDKNDKNINHYTDIKIPLMRNMETIISGPFLTQKKGDGGIGIDDNFDNEHVVIIKD